MAFKVDPNKGSHILISIPIIGLLTVGTVKALEHARDKWGWFKFMKPHPAAPAQTPPKA